MDLQRGSFAAFVGAGLLVPLAAPVVRAADEPEIRFIELPGYNLLSLSPDGQLLAANSDSHPALCVFDTESLAERVCADLAAPPVRPDLTSVAWSPDSSRIALTERLQPWDLWVMDTSTGEMTNLTDDGFEGSPSTADLVVAETTDYVHRAPAWTPDGGSITTARMAFVDDEGGYNEIVDVDFVSGDVEPLTIVSADEPGAVSRGIDWADDGQRLFYTVSEGLGGPNDGIWEFDRSTGQSRQRVTTDPELGPPALVEVSATGEFGLVIYVTALSSGDNGRQDRLMLVNFETGEVAAIDPASSATDDPVTVRNATFSANGTEVLFSTYDDKVGRLWVRGLPDGQAAEVAASIDWAPAINSYGRGLDWASDGTVFANNDLDGGVLLHLDPTAN